MSTIIIKLLLIFQDFYYLEEEDELIYDDFLTSIYQSDVFNLTELKFNSLIVDYDTIFTFDLDLLYFFSKYQLFKYNYTKLYLFSLNNTIFTIFESFLENLINNLLLNYLIIILIFFPFVNIFSNLKKNKNEEYDIINNLELLILEEELSNVEDMKFLTFFMFFSFLIYFSSLFSLLLLKHFVFKTLFFLVYFFLFLIIIIFSLSFIYSYGIYIVGYLRGSSVYRFKTFEFIYDNIALIAFYTRLYLQFFRLILITGIFIELYENIFNDIFTNVLENYLKNLYNILINDTNYLFIENSSFLTSFFKKILFIINFFFKLIFNGIHFIYTIGGQFVTFFLIIFNIIIFLYTSFSNFLMESYFLSKK